MEQKSQLSVKIEDEPRPKIKTITGADWLQPNNNQAALTEGLQKEKSIFKGHISADAGKLCHLDHKRAPNVDIEMRRKEKNYILFDGPDDFKCYWHDKEIQLKMCWTGKGRHRAAGALFLDRPNLRWCNGAIRQLAGWDAVGGSLMTEGPPLCGQDWVFPTGQCCVSKWLPDQGLLPDVTFLAQHTFGEGKFTQTDTKVLK